MNRMTFPCPLMEEAGETGAGGTAATVATEPTPAAAAHTETPAEPQPSAEAEPASAAAAHTGETPNAAEPTAKPDGEPKAEADGEIDLANTSDEDYAKLVQPDVEGQEVDRSLITPMAAALKEAGIQPSVMAKVGEIYKKVVGEAISKDKAERDAAARKLADEANAAFSDDDWKDFGACFSEHIAKDRELSHLVCHTELGSNQTFIRICNLVGATLRAEKSPPASAAAASSQTDLDRAVFEQTVPKHLR